jgi:3-methylcrotonyl-CoA carboxylase alpha subunit
MSRALRLTYRLGDRSFDVALHLAAGQLSGELTEEEDTLSIEVPARRLVDGRIRLGEGERSVRATVFRDGDTIWVCIDGQTYEVAVEEAGARAALHAGEEDFAVSPMTGTLAKVAVRPGEQIEAGQELFIVEAMKMEYVVKAPRALEVAEVRNAVGDSIEQGRVVVTFVVEEA